VALERSKRLLRFARENSRIFLIEKKKKKKKKERKKEKKLRSRMAKLGEGDPRWIVENRDADAHNLNNWHWTDKTLLPWVQSYLAERWPGTVFARASEKSLRFVIGAIEHVKGEVVANVRKGRSLVTYEMDIKVKWLCFATNGKDDDESDDQVDVDQVPLAEGHFHLPYVSDENDPDDFSVKVSLSTKSTKELERVKSEARTHGIKWLRPAVVEFIGALLSSHSSKGVPNTVIDSSSQAPSSSSAAAEDPVAALAKNAKAPLAKVALKQHEPVVLTRTGSSGVVTQTLELRVRFEAAVNDVFACFADERRVKAYSGGDARFDAKVGGEFALFSGNVVGKIVDIKPNELLVESWRFREWPSSHNSLVTLQFDGKESSCTVVTLRHESIPRADFERTKSGWHTYFFDRFRQCFFVNFKVL
jgi:activator of Hsp90 ATPase protein 1